MSRCETDTRRSDTERGGTATASTYLQGAEAGAPRHRYLEQSDEHHSFVRSRHRSSASPPSRPVSLTTTSARRSLVARSRPPSVCCCPVSSPSTPSARARRPSPSTRAPDKVLHRRFQKTNGSFQSQPLFHERVLPICRLSSVYVLFCHLPRL